jgi:hypothetical protein
VLLRKADAAEVGTTRRVNDPRMLPFFPNVA